MKELFVLLAFCMVCSAYRYDYFENVVLEMKKEYELPDQKPHTDFEYTINTVNADIKVFDGIGGLSGGGATSRLLVNYPKKQLDEILDYLFKPNFGASLHILKVEIGGDAQSTDGTESSHMHTETETPNFQRGYEWWLMKEAKKRNPEIKLIGLPWAWPGWIGQNTVWPYTNNTKAVDYVITWILGAKSEHDLTIDYIGDWNERPYDADYVKLLRKTLDKRGLSHVAIIVADESIGSTISGAILKDDEFKNAVDIIGTHYPGTLSTSDAEKTGKKLWSSEDYSTFNDNTGAGCWARILNNNFVNGNMTSTIAWNLIASYYDDLPFKRCSLMTANEPWSGHYEVPAVLWATAHTTQFTQPGWLYFTKASGHLLKGGSYVTLSNPTGTELTLVLQTMSHDNSKCIRPPLPAFNVEKQNVVINLNGNFHNLTKMHMWTTDLSNKSTADKQFVHSMIDVTNGKISFVMLPDMLVTLTTLTTGMKGDFGTIPSSAAFPLPYQDNFENMPEFSEAPNFADQSGVFEIYENKSSTDGHQWTMRQVVTQRPLTWCEDSDSPISVVGDYSWSQVNVTVDVKLENSAGVFVALKVDSGGCDVRSAKGAFLWLHMDGQWSFTTSLERTKILKRCYSDWSCWQENNPKLERENWNTLSLAIDHDTVYGYVNHVRVFSTHISTLHDLPKNGWAAFGVMNFAYAQFDNFKVAKLN